jgi:phospholipid N-methyltransferase
MQEFRMGNSHAEHIVSKNDDSTARAPSGDALLFARNFFRHPRMLGSIIPSSRFLIKQLLQPVDWDKARVIVEYGPGVGGITAEILRRMRPDACLIAIETNPEFVSFLRKSLVDDRFHVMQASAADVREILQQHGHARASYIISGIPLGAMPRKLREPILRNTCEALEPGGSFLVYQFTTRVLPDLQRIFRYVRRKFEPLNVLPAHLFFCQQPGAA